MKLILNCSSCNVNFIESYLFKHLRDHHGAQRCGKWVRTIELENPEITVAGPKFDMTSINFVATPCNILELFWRFLFDEMSDLINALTVCSNVSLINTSTGNPNHIMVYNLSLRIPTQGIVGYDNTQRVEHLDSDFGDTVFDIIGLDCFKRMTPMYPHFKKKPFF